MTPLTREALLILSVTGLLFLLLKWITWGIKVYQRYQVRRELKQDTVPMTLERRASLQAEWRRQRRDVDQV